MLGVTKTRIRRVGCKSLAMARSRISVVLPVYNEDANIAACLRGLWKALAAHEHEILVCYDFDEDKTLPAIAAMSDKPPTVRLVRNSLGRGAAFAIRAGFAAAEGDVVVTTMADLCDPPEVIPLMAEKIRAEGADVVAGSRYMRGGSQSGGPLLKRTISRWVGYSMWWIAHLGTHDATTNFRAYSKRFLDTNVVESKTSFDIALELTVKAHLAGAKITEVPSSWIDRTAGTSRFRMWKWMPNYLRWYVRAMAAPLFVGVVWLAMFWSANHFVATYASVIPFQDDLELAPQFVPGSPLVGSWIFDFHNEHRVPIAGLLMVGLTRLTSDIRSGMYGEVVILGLVSLAMILFMQRLRGRTSVSDAFFPLLWLHCGNCENLLMAFQLSLMLPVACVSAFLMLVARRAGPPSPNRMALAGACAALLPLNGGHGWTQAPPIFLWLMFAGFMLRRSADARARRAGVVAWVFALLVAALAACYFIGYESPNAGLRTLNVGHILIGAANFLSLCIGAATEELWPYSVVLVLAIVAATVWLLVRACLRPAERLRALGMLAAMCGVISMALAAGWGRHLDDVHSGIALRYGMLPSNVLCCAYFAWTLYGSRIAARTARWMLCVLMAAMLPINVKIGTDYGMFRSMQSEAFMKDFDAGMSLGELARTHAPNVFDDVERFEARLKDLEKARLEPFAHHGATPELKLEPSVLQKLHMPMPIAARSPEPIAPLEVLERDVLLVRPPGELRFSV
jgi:glycosyltransferase involved in cell wall biosynthesis